MANPLLLDIALFLKAAGTVVGDGKDTFRDFIPEEPDNIVVLYEYRGDPASLFDEAVNRSVQITVRNKKADVARQKAIEIFKALKTACNEDGKLNFTNERWGQVFFRQPPFPLGRDENNRAQYAFNVGITTTID